MKAIIIAAGMGTRLRPHTNHKPKCMVECRESPFCITKSMRLRRTASMILLSLVATSEVEFKRLAFGWFLMLNMPPTIS